MSLSGPNISAYTTNFEVYVSKPDFKFNAAHFVAYRGFRERMHGHNYTVGVRLLGSRHLSYDGYVLDFGDVKKVVKVVCKRLNERFLCPTESDVIDMKFIDTKNGNELDYTVGDDVEGKNIVLLTEDGSKFEMPLDDCAMIPIVHATVEELAIYMWGEIIQGLDSGYLRKRGIHTMEVIVAEAPGQEAVFRYEIPEKSAPFDIPSFIKSGDIDIIPKPCLGAQKEEKETGVTGVKCQCGASAFRSQLERIASALNSKPRSGNITAEDLQCMLASENSD